MCKFTQLLATEKVALSCADTTELPRKSLLPSHPHPTYPTCAAPAERLLNLRGVRHSHFILPQSTRHKEPLYKTWLPWGFFLGNKLLISHIVRCLWSKYLGAINIYLYLLKWVPSSILGFVSIISIKNPSQISLDIVDHFSEDCSSPLWIFVVAHWHRSGPLWWSPFLVWGGGHFSLEVRSQNGMSHCPCPQEAYYIAWKQEHVVLNAYKRLISIFLNAPDLRVQKLEY